MAIRLLTPGPVELHPKALAALALPQLHHRTDEARKIFLSAREGLKRAFSTKGEVLILTGSGTLAMEALALNLFSPGNRVWVPVHGKFSERWAEIAVGVGLEAVVQQLPWGSVARPEHLEKIADPIHGALLTHSETSTGALNDIRLLAQAVKARNPSALVVADMVTSLLVSAAELESWGIDAAASGSQKGAMCPPGLGFAALSPLALEALKPRGYYLNLGKELRMQKEGESAWTPAINLVRALASVLEEVVPGLDEHLELKSKQTRILYESGDSLGLTAVPEVRSPATAAFYLPEGIPYGKVKQVFSRHGAVIAGGQGPLKGKIFRVSLMGHSGLEDARWAAGILREAVDS